MLFEIQIWQFINFTINQSIEKEEQKIMKNAPHQVSRARVDSNSVFLLFSLK